jgi:hypothetical protein
VQVKTTTFHSKDGWMVSVGHHPDGHSKKGHLLAYDPDEIDLFFIVDGGMTMYLIRAVPSRDAYEYCSGRTRSTSSAMRADCLERRRRDSKAVPRRD